MTISRRALLAAGTLPAFPAIGRAQSAPVKVGVILPTTGVLAFPGQASLRGIRLGEQVVRERGARLEFSVVDTESRPENGRIAAERLIREGCSVLIGAWDSGTTISAAQACEAARVPLLVNIASAPQVTEQGFTQVFRNFTPGGVLVRNAVARIKELLDGRPQRPRNAVLMYVNDTFGTANLAAFEAFWPSSGIGIEVVEKIGYDVRARDLSAEVARAKATGADLLLPITRVNDAIMIVREMVRQDYNPMAIIGPGSPGPYEKAFTDALARFGDDYMSCVPWYNPRNPRATAVVERFERTNPGQRFELNVGFSYEAVEIVADAVARARSAEPAAIHAALRTTDIAEPWMFGGPIRFDEKGQNNNIGGVMLQNRGGQPLVVGPREAAVAEPRFPMTPFRARS